MYLYKAVTCSPSIDHFIEQFKDAETLTSAFPKLDPDRKTRISTGQVQTCTNNNKKFRIMQVGFEKCWITFVHINTISLT